MGGTCGTAAHQPDGPGRPDPRSRARRRILGAIRRLAELFARWIAAGHIPADLGSPQDLAYALLSPIAQARLLWLHGAARQEDIAAARDRAARHAEFFVKAVFPASPAPAS